MVYVGMFFTVFITVTAFAIDMSRLYVARSQVQKAADSAALAGAYQHANLTGYRADFEAREYAKKPENGRYEHGVRSTTVTTLYQPNDELGVKQNNWFRVSIQRAEPTFFAGIMGRQFRNVTVGASSTAMYETTVAIDTTGTTSGTYGIAPGPANLALFGPDAWYNNGDKYSGRMLADYVTPNPDYVGPESTKSRKGYDFLITIPESFKTANSAAYFQIFDPDCYNSGNNVNPNGTTRIDEMRTSAGGLGMTDPNKNNKSTATITKYQLYLDNGTPEYSDDTPLGDARSYGADSSTDMKWIDFYSGNPRLLPAGQGLRLNVMTTDGSSENGFALRVNNQPASSNSAFNSNNGTQIKADGYLPINFNVTGTVTMALGNVPINAAGTQLSISKFDTDVQAKSVRYFCDPAPSNQPAAGYPGVLSNNGEEETDKISLPANYKGGQWTAKYEAGSQDTSVWSMSYTGAGPGKPGKIKIVR